MAAAAAAQSRMKGEWRHAAVATRDTAGTGRVRMADVKPKVMRMRFHYTQLLVLHSSAMFSSVQFI